MESKIDKLRSDFFCDVFKAILDIEVLSNEAK